MKAPTTISEMQRRLEAREKKKGRRFHIDGPKEQCWCRSLVRSRDDVQSWEQEDEG